MVVGAIISATAPDKASISTVAVAELVVEEPSCYPVSVMLCEGGKIPVAPGMRIVAFGNASHGFYLWQLFDITPVAGKFRLAVLFKVSFP